MKCSVAPTGLSTALIMYALLNNAFPFRSTKSVLFIINTCKNDIGAVKANIAYLY